VSQLAGSAGNLTMVLPIGIQRWMKERMNEGALGRDRILGEFNASTLDPTGSLRADQEMKVVSERHSLTVDRRRFMKRKLWRQIHTSYAVLHVRS